MTHIINSAAALGDHGREPFHREPEPPTPRAETAPAAGEPTDTADVRLMIEDGGAEAGFVYTTVDRRTGAVIRKLPRDGLLKLGEARDYAAGALIKTRA